MFTLLASCLVFPLLGGCADASVDPTAAEDLLFLNADQVMFEMDYYFTTDGIRQAVLKADTAYQWNDSTAIHLRGVDLKVYGETGEDRAELTSESGSLDRQTNRMTARGSVVLFIPAENRTVESAELHYDAGGDRVWSDSATVMTHGDQVVTGSGFESDLQFRNWVIRDSRTRGGGLRF